MTLTVAKMLTSGQTIYHTTRRNADGTSMRARVTSIKTWKRDPERIEVHTKHGLYDYSVFSERDLSEISNIEPIYNA